MIGINSQANINFANGSIQVRIEGLGVANAANELHVDVHLQRTSDNDATLVVLAASAALTFRRPHGRNVVDPNSGISITGLWSIPNHELHVPLSFAIDQNGIRSMDAAVSRVTGLHYEFTASVMLHTERGPKRVPVRSSGLINNDDWRELRTSLGLGRCRLFEISAQSFTNLAEFEQAVGLLESANLDLACGSLEQCALKSRKVIDSVTRCLGFAGASGPIQYEAIAKDLRAQGLDEKAVNGVDNILRGFGQLAGVEAHPSDFRWRRADAELVLNLAATLASFVGTLPGRATGGA